MNATILTMAGIAPAQLHVAAVIATVVGGGGAWGAAKKQQSVVTASELCTYRISVVTSVADNNSGVEVAQVRLRRQLSSQWAVGLTRL